ncbi:hypothetical protein [Burkholderia sp. L27(2015)]|uniref:hypothetical protein n=1 Tax=Burkholderia sp. L27(2015) TaxID=1641858 RepID=UPI00131D816F|nr:hypothetical protein [Burkholderia sp. L27(2015)]
MLRIIISQNDSTVTIFLRRRVSDFVCAVRHEWRLAAQESGSPGAAVVESRPPCRGDEIGKHSGLK